MKTARIASQSRSHLDERFLEIGGATRFAPPVRGWIKALREGLGMSSAQLASRLGVKQPSVTAMEQSEASGTIELATLRRTAQALDCTLVYALIPNRPLAAIVRDRARMLARRHLMSVEHSMLEGQKLDEKNFEVRLDRLVGEMNPRRLWDES